MSDTAVAGEPHDPTRASQAIDRCNTAAITALGLLGPAHALLQNGAETTPVIVVALLTTTQALAIFTILSAGFAVWRLKNGEAVVTEVMKTIPMNSCCATCTLLIVATCVIHWKAACVLIGMAGTSLVIVFRANGTQLPLLLENINYSRSSCFFSAEM
ncbi:hypothetical protein AURDEDRAFT_167049 [Auricularia subglabra TFB-10046 SS5]|nr:hypothetical protein AURDEDRAFT_167049 [Auricularia subglabra TFB-10046 SS5]